MADLVRRQGYDAEEPPSRESGSDLLVSDLDGKRVAVQLKRYVRPVGYDAAQVTFTGMAHYRAE